MRSFAPTATAARLIGYSKGANDMPTKDEREPFYRVDVAEAKRDAGRRRRRRHRRARPGRVPDRPRPGATLIPVNSVFARREELPKDKKILFVCAVGQRSALAAEMAAAAGLPADPSTRSMAAPTPGARPASRRVAAIQDCELDHPSRLVRSRSHDAHASCSGTSTTRCSTPAAPAASA